MILYGYGHRLSLSMPNSWSYMLKKSDLALLLKNKGLGLRAILSSTCLDLKMEIIIPFHTN